MRNRLPFLAVFAFAVACSSGPGDTGDDAGTTAIDATDAGATAVDAGSGTGAGSGTDAGMEADAGSADAGATPDDTKAFVRLFDVNVPNLVCGTNPQDPTTIIAPFSVTTYTLSDGPFDGYVQLAPGTAVTCGSAAGFGTAVLPATIGAGDHVTVVVQRAGNAFAAAFVKEQAASGADKIRFNAASATQVTVTDQDGTALATIAAGGTASFEVPDTTQQLVLDDGHHYSLVSRAEAGASHLLLVGRERDVGIVRAAGTQAALLPDVLVSGLNVSISVGSPMSMEVVTPGATIEIAHESLGFKTGLTAAKWVPMPATKVRFTGPGGTLEKAFATDPEAPGDQEQIFVAHGGDGSDGIVQTGNETRAADPSERAYWITNVNAWKARFGIPSVGSSTWIPSQTSEFVAPGASWGLVWNANGASAITLGISINADNIADESIALSGLTGNHNLFYFNGSSSVDMGVLNQDRTLTVFKKQP